MKLTTTEISLESLILSPEQLSERTPGTHVSAIIHRISESIGRRKGDFSESDLDQFAAIGRLWEAQLALSLFPPPRYIRLGELECDGIIGSPDAYDTQDQAVIEMKVTWKSAKRPIEEFREYWWQAQSYCHITQTCRAILPVLFVCGDYKPPVPVFRQYKALFTPQELRSNWEMMLRNR